MNSKRLNFFGLGAAAIIFAAGAVIWSNNSNAFAESNPVTLNGNVPAYSNKISDQPIQSAEDLKRVAGIEFSETQSTQTEEEPQIDKISAIEAANKITGYADVASSIHAEYHVISSDSFYTEGFSKEAKTANPKLVTSELIKDTPVWIVSFEGLNIHRSGKKGNKDYVMTEDNIVVDATTGQVLFGFKYR
ncbi:hypothetical protein GRF59_08360 [Paenibacillus sp. HJL G12]|uniref:Uncharacterized protein n=1 Tax=Paenibacillus dendrobii TaxID=2691084 RepID=A0A7X3IGR8_9BACL|nr:hypothetical protein [Paenibacillus dendrobii]MWV43647.1 hypothetical protein [Paenibacillus dendrobii]